MDQVAGTAGGGGSSDMIFYVLMWWIVAGVQVVVNQVAATQAVDHCWCVYYSVELSVKH